LRIRKDASAGELLAYLLAGLGAGLVAGFALGELLGDVNRPRLTRAYGRWSGEEPEPPAALGASAAARAARAALVADDALQGLDLAPKGLGEGAVELRGWVPSRALRARAVRTVRAVPGIDRLVNSILVRGEDDALLPPDHDVADQSA